MAAPSSIPFYGQPLLREEITELRGRAEDSLNDLYVNMLDYIDVLEGRVRNLERHNRELRGQLGKVG